MKCGNPTSRTGTFKPSKSRLSPGWMTAHVLPARKRTPAHHWPHRGGNLYHHDAHLRVPALHTDRQRHGLQHAPKTANPTRLNNSFTTCASFRKTGSSAIPPHKEKSNATTTRSKNGSPPNHQPQPSPACKTSSTRSPASTTMNAPTESSTGAPPTHHPVLILIAGNDTITIDRTTGEIIAEHTIDPTHLPAQKTHQRHYTCQQRRDTPVNNDVTHPHTKKPGHRQQTVNDVPTHHKNRLLPASRQTHRTFPVLSMERPNQPRCRWCKPDPVHL